MKPWPAGAFRTPAPRIRTRFTHQQGATLTEYLPPLVLVLVFAIPAWAKYGETVREHVAHAAGRLAEHYYHGWFWPVEENPLPGGPARPGGGGSSGPLVGEGDAASAGGSPQAPLAGLPSHPMAGLPLRGTGNSRPTGSTENTFSPTPNSAGSDNTQCTRGASPTPLSGNAPSHSEAGNPIDLGSGNKLQTERDYHSRRPGGLFFLRHYNSVLGHEDRGLGHGWRHSYQRAIVLTDDTATAWRDDGSQYAFTLPASGQGAWQPPIGIVETLTPVTDRHGTRTGWTYTPASGEREHYDAQGRLQRIEHLAGHQQTLHYQRDGRLERITDSRGETLTLHWRGPHLSHLSTPSGDRLAYSYDDQHNLTRLTRRPPGLTGWLAGLRTPERRYHYHDPRHPHALTGLDDATGARFATWQYDALGRAISSEHGDGAGRITLDYRQPADPASGQREVVVSNALGHRTVYTLEPARPGKWRLIARDGAPTLQCAGVAERQQYDDRGRLVRQSTAGIGSQFQYDAQGRLVQATHGLRFPHAAGDGQPAPGATRLDYQWQGTSSRLARVTLQGWAAPGLHRPVGWQPVHRQDWQYDPRGRLRTATHTDLSPQATPGGAFTRTTRYQYQDHDPAPGDPATPGLRTLTVTDPRGHATTYHYDREERLHGITNALGQHTHIDAFTRGGQPKRIALPDGQQLHIEHDAHGRPLRLIRHPAPALPGQPDPQPPSEITRLAYDAEGRLARLQRPDGSEQGWRYNSAGHLIEQQNGWGERITLTPHPLHGQWDTLWHHDADGDPVLLQVRQFNAMGQLVGMLGHQGQKTTFTYDARGDLVAASEGDENPANSDKDHITTARYNSQHRLLELTDAAGFSTHYSHGAGGHIDSVTDANSNTTEYVRNGFGEIITHKSPTTGSVIKRYDGNGNLISKQHPEGSEILFHYDSLNRLAWVDYPGESSDVRYSYDQTNSAHGNGMGRLTRIDTAHQAIDYRYDGLGRKIQEKTEDKDEAGTVTSSDTLKYAYLPGNRLARITYPDGSKVDYLYDRDRMSDVRYESATEKTAKILVKDIAYAPLGGPVAWTYGNALTQRKRLDLDGRVKSIELADNSLAEARTLWLQQYSYDHYQNISGIHRKENQVTSERRFYYDVLDRLTQEEAVMGAGSGKTSSEATRNRYVYDAMGNRRNYEDTPAIHHDENGNVETVRSTGDERRYAYNARNRPAALYQNQELRALYGYSALGWRQNKRTYHEKGSLSTRYIYTASGQLLSESRDDGEGLITTVQYIWLGASPVAQIERRMSDTERTPAQITYLHADHLTAPRLATDASQRIIWRWHSDAFGNGMPEDDPDQDGQRSTINLRFAGQYADEESGLYYNLHRYYDPKTGRYTQSDPLGLLPSLNTYSYVDANPVNWLDPLGLAKLQYALIDSFGGNPSDSSRSTLKAGTDKRMIHFAFLLTDIAGAPGASLIYDPLGIAPLVRDKGWHSWNSRSGLNGVGSGMAPWDDFRGFYEKSHGGKRAFNTGDWAIISDYSDSLAVELYHGITGHHPSGHAGDTCALPKSLEFPDLPSGFYAMENFNFPTMVHKLNKPIFKAEQLPAANSDVFLDVPWFTGTFKNEGSDNPVSRHYSRRPHKLEQPPGSGKAIDQSGVTIGRGYDLGQKTQSEVTSLLTRVGLPEAQRQLLKKAVGIKGDPHITFYNRNEKALRDIELTREQRYLVYLSSVKKAHDEARRKYDEYIRQDIAWEQLDGRIRDILIDMDYRGDLRNISENTTQKPETPFDDVAFAKEFREAVSNNNPGDFCRVMNNEENWTSENSWNVPVVRWLARANTLKNGGVCQS